MGEIFYRVVWQLSEFTGIGLGRFAPYVFGQMIQREGTEKGGDVNGNV